VILVDLQTPEKSDPTDLVNLDMLKPIDLQGEAWICVGTAAHPAVLRRLAGSTDPVCKV